MKKEKTLTDNIEKLNKSENKNFLEAMEVATETFREVVMYNIPNFVLEPITSYRVRPELYKLDEPVAFKIEFGNNSWNAIEFKSAGWSHDVDEGIEIKTTFHTNYYGSIGGSVRGTDTIELFAAFGAVVGKVAELKEELNDAMQNAMHPFAMTDAMLREQRYKCERELRELNQEKQRKADEELMSSVINVGYDVPVGPHGYHPTFDYGYKKSLHNVKHVQITKLSKSGETATMVVTCGNDDYKHIIDRMRVKNLTVFIKQNS